MKLNRLFIVAGILVLFGCCPFNAAAQTAQLKAPLSEEDNKFLKKELIKDICGFDANFGCSLLLMNVDSLSPQLQANYGNIALLRKKLKGNISDASICLLIADIFNRLKMHDSVDYFEKRGLADYDALIAKKPDSTNLYEEAGLACLTGGYTDAAIMYYRKEMAVKPNSATPVCYIAMAYIFKGQLDSMFNVITTHIHQYPEDEGAYYVLPFYYFFKLAQRQNDTNYIKKLTLDSATRIPLLDKYYASHPDSFDIKFLHYEALQVLTAVRIDLELSVGIDSIPYEQDKGFFLKPEETEMLMRNKEFFESCLNNKSKTYRYCSNKYAAISWLYLNQPHKAIPYLKNAIKLFPQKKASSLLNAGEDYDNLLSAYFIIHDTNSMEKLLLEKIKVLPRVDPEPEDYIKLADLNIIRNKLKTAQEYCDKALTINDKNTDALIINGFLAYLNKDYQKASDAINKLYAIDNTYGSNYLLYGAVLLAQNNIYNAYETFKLADKNSGKDKTAKEIMRKFFVAKN